MIKNKTMQDRRYKRFVEKRERLSILDGNVDLELAQWVKALLSLLFLLRKMRLDPFFVCHELLGVFILVSAKYFFIWDGLKLLYFIK